jgi:hypothetical protein
LLALVIGRQQAAVNFGGVVERRRSPHSATTFSPLNFFRPPPVR